MNVNFEEQYTPAPTAAHHEKQGFVMKLALKTGIVKTEAQARILLLAIAIGAIILSVAIWIF